MKRIFTLFLVLTMLACLFSSCGENGVKPDDSDTVDSAVEQEAVAVEIAAENIAEYKIIRATNASQPVKDAATAFTKELKAEIGDGVAVKEDWIKPTDSLPEKAKEIVIGKTNRPDSPSIEKTLRENDYAIIMKNDRIYIIGGSDSATLEAVEHFRTHYFDKDAKKITLRSDLNEYYYYEYPVKSVKLNGVDLREYTVVIPENCDVYTTYAAENFNDFLFANAGYTVNTVSDATAATEYEILIGATNRPQSTAPAAENGQYNFFADGKKVVCLGSSYFVGGGVSELISRIDVSAKNVETDITDLPTDKTPKTFTFSETAKSAIVMIGDGMGFNSIEAAKMLNAITTFNGYDLPHRGQAKTYSLSGTTDSAASATALSTGFKTINKYLGVDKNNNTLLNVRELADKAGAKTAVVTTDLITGATPAGFLVHHNSRSDTAVIQEQIDKVISEGKIEYCEGSVGDDLKRHTVNALRKISVGGSPFFIMIEEGYIDKNSHNNKMPEMAAALARFNDDIAYVIEFAVCHPDTALIITADHETGAITYNEATSKYEYTSGSHSNVDVPVCAVGAGTSVFNGAAVENIEIAKFTARIFGDNNFGQ